LSQDDPFTSFSEIYAQALALPIKNPNAMVLSTADENGHPSSRVVLLKGFDHEGFVFYTNLESRKGRQIAARPQVSLSFYWRELGKQVTVAGQARQVSEEEADAYFASRPRGSQLGAWASQQSQRLRSRAELLARVAKHEARFLARKIPRPPHWSGFRVQPTYFEFWTEGAFRLHDRVAYERRGDEWTRYRLYP
jgi:pyridoxamine 5'-phosphate oxidase